ncbi:DMT family transporter [Halobaculum gomorrense]|uniref:Permease of the drug/metabolite transporter (DMT) superfamily n=1 Tax=Halobaculum gomorrense TaxID=43928 RepID=A0A1M5P015_9EURY|nr:DMT family transporter [Halobaculum gomorrense]SHG94553.1 Permease of the drug/metabolite transporter (DMT) superfamily [Halobaculum gomorrense]
MTRYRSLGLFLVLAAIWGSAFMAIKAGLAFFPPVLFAALRYDIAGVVMLAYALYVTDVPLPRDRAEWTEVAIGAVLLIAAYHALLFVGELDPRVTSAAAAVVVSLSPVLTTGFARVLLPSERLTAVGIVGMVLALVGVAVLSELDPSNLLAGGTIPKLLILGAAAAFALGSVLTRRVGSDLPIATMEAWSMIGGAAIMHAVSLALGESLGSVVLNRESIAALAYLSLAASAVGFLIYFELLDRLGPVEINLVSYVAPVFAALAGWALLDEVPTAPTGVGFLLIFLGFLLLKRHAIRAEVAGLVERDAPTTD